MKQLFRYVKSIERRFPNAIQVSSVGYIWSRVPVPYREKFDRYVYCIVTRGRGWLRHDQVTLPVVAPCLLLLRPENEYEYCPERSWDETYIVVRREHEPALNAARLIPEAGSVWPLSESRDLRQSLDEMLALARRPDALNNVDAVDRAACRLLFEAVRGILATGPNDRDLAIDRIKAYVQSNIWKDHDFNDLAAEHGLSPATFRRRWARSVGCPPARLLTERRLAEACTLLVETPISIGEISRRLHFQDETSFARRFRRYAGMSATQFRKRFRRTGES